MTSLGASNPLKSFPVNQERIVFAIAVQAGLYYLMKARPS